MRFLRFFLVALAIGLLAIFFQGAILRPLLGSWVVPNLLMIGVVYIAFRSGTSLGALLVFCLGLEMDFCSGKLIGPWAGAFVLVYAVLSLISQRVFIESAFAAFAAVFASTLAGSLIFTLLISNDPGFSISFVSVVLGEALFTGILAPVVFPLLDKMFKRRDRSGGSF